MDYKIRPVNPDEYDAFARASSAAFGTLTSVYDDRERDTFEYDRSLAVFDQEHIVATAGAFSFDMTLPGLTQIPVAGVSWVGVLPTYHRRGILRAMMRRQLNDIRERGEAVAVLTASESAIYGRFGYGLATSAMNVEIERGYSAFGRPLESTGRLELIAQDEAAPLLPDLYDRIRPTRVGELSRDSARWNMMLRNRTEPLDGSKPAFFVRYVSQAGETDGLVTYTIQNQWENGAPTSVLTISELLAITPEARVALWDYCLNVDLVRTVRAVNRPVEDPLRWMLADPRRLRVTSLVDHLWVRLLDIPTALSARRYTSAGRIVFDVKDVFCPENSGRYVVEGGPDGAKCLSTTEEPELTVDVEDLGAAYLGGVSFSMLAQAGRVAAQAPGATQRADAMFVGTTAPWCTTHF